MKNNKAAINKLAAVYRRWRKEQDAVTDLIKKTFPVGMEVQYRHGDHLRFAKVVDHCYGMDLLVTGRTSLRYRVGAARILDAMADRGI